MGTASGFNIGMCFDREYPPSFVVDVAEALEANGIDQLWVIEDCFYTAGVSLAATALARTERLQVGLGILPVVARNPAVTAMEVATLAGLAPGRLLAGLGHGVQDWMAQMGARVASPLTALEETIIIVRRLLHGENVTLDGRMYHMDHVQLDQPPEIVPPVLAGVRQAKSLRVAGERADGLVLAEGAGPNYIRWALEQAAPPSSDEFHVSILSALSIDDDGRVARGRLAPFLGELSQSPNPALDRHSHIDEIRERFVVAGEDGLTDMPSDWWTEFGAIGTFDDAATHIERLREAGAHDVSFFVGPEIDGISTQIDHISRLRTALPR